MANVLDEMGHWNLADEQVVQEPVLTNRFFLTFSLEAQGTTRVTPPGMQNAEQAAHALHTSPQYAYPMHF